MSALARRRMSLAQKARWAKAKVRAPKPKRTNSPAGRERIAAASVRELFHTGCEERDECMMGAVFEARRRFVIKAQKRRLHGWGLGRGCGKPPSFQNLSSPEVANMAKRFTPARPVRRLGFFLIFLSTWLVWSQSAKQRTPGLPPELEPVRAALEKYQDPIVAVHDGYLSTVGCADFPNDPQPGHEQYPRGAMGIHFLEPIAHWPKRRSAAPANSSLRASRRQIPIGRCRVVRAALDKCKRTTSITGASLLGANGRPRASYAE